MKNKRNIIAFILLLLPLLVAVGMSTWIILNESFLNPSYNPDPVIKKYFSKEKVTYNGSPQSPTSSTSDLVDFGELKFEYRNFKPENDPFVEGKPTNAGHYVVRVTIIDLDNSAREIDFIIEPKPISIEVYGDQNFTFNNEIQRPSIKIIDGDLIEGDECKIVATNDSKKAGSYTIVKNDIQLLNSNYIVKEIVNPNYEISRFTLNESYFQNISNCKYDGSKQEPAIKANISFSNGKIYSLKSSDYKVTYSNNINQGTATAEVTGIGNFTGTVTLNFTIEEGLINLEKAVISNISNLTYSGKAQTPTFKVSIGGTELTNGTDFTFSCSHNIDAGEATLTLNPISGRSENTQSVNFTISPLSITINSLLIDYNSTIRNWVSFSSNILTVLTTKINNENSVTLASNDVIINGMHNGYFKYGTIETDDVITTYNNSVVGSTYKLNVTLSNNIIINDSTNNLGFILLKYQTVKLGYGSTTYYTIEDAILKTNDSSTIILEGESSNTTFVYTSFSALSIDFTKYNTTVENNIINYTLNKNIRIPFASVDMDFHGSGGKTYVEKPGLFLGTTTSKDGCDSIAVNEDNKVYSGLYIPSNIKIILESSKTFIVGGLLTSCGNTKNRGVVYNNGLIELQNNSHLYSYGFIKGTGNIVANKNSTITDVFRLYDWAGGATSAGLNNEKIFPVTQYSAHNISCKVKIFPDAKYDVFWNIEFSNKLYGGFQRGDKNGNVILIGSNGLFKLETGYIIKYATGGREISSTTTTNQNQLNNITGSNQSIGQKDTIEIYGKCTDSSISIKISATGTSFSMSTNTSMALPISFMDIYVKYDETIESTFTLSTSSYLFLPGTSLNIEENTEFNINNGSIIHFYSTTDAISDLAKMPTPFIKSDGGNCKERIDALLNIGGTVVVDSNSYLSGKVNIMNSEAILNLNNYKTSTVKYVTNIKDGTFADTVTTSYKSYTLFGDIYNGTTIEKNKEFYTGKFKSTSDYWKNE